MPIIYRQRSTSSLSSDADSDLENIAPTPIDADDSIVLSDLVRTGEASRLRRRGAMRLDHGHTGQQTSQPQSYSPAVIVVGSPSWESDSEETPGGSGYPRTRNGRGPRPRRAGAGASRGDDDLSFTYTIFCGADEDEFDSEFEFGDQSCTPYEPSVLPLYPSSSRAPPFSQRKARKSNGCGAVLHMSAAPRQRNGTWLAKDTPSTAVVLMDADYFDKNIASRIVRSSCGCFREGVGCAVW